MKAAALTVPLLLTALTLSGCDQIQGKLGIEDAATKAAKLEAEGKAIGSACRQSGRAIEDCYSVYTWVPKAAVFNGWKEMDAYMRENSLEIVEPQLPPPPPPPPPPEKKKKKKKASEADAAKTEEKPTEEKSGGH